MASVLTTPDTTLQLHGKIVTQATLKTTTSRTNSLQKSLGNLASFPGRLGKPETLLQGLLAAVLSRLLALSLAEAPRD